MFPHIIHCSFLGLIFGWLSTFVVSDKVCGSDFVTYKSMKNIRQKRAQGIDLDIVGIGSCDDVCLSENHLCGTDGRTYYNYCHLLLAMQRGERVSLRSVGHCALAGLESPSSQNDAATEKPLRNLADISKYIDDILTNSGKVLGENTRRSHSRSKSVKKVRTESNNDSNQDQSGEEGKQKRFKKKGRNLGKESSEMEKHERKEKKSGKEEKRIRENNKVKKGKKHRKEKIEGSESKSDQVEENVHKDKKSKKEEKHEDKESKTKRQRNKDKKHDKEGKRKEEKKPIKEESKVDKENNMNREKKLRKDKMKIDENKSQKEKNAEKKEINEEKDVLRQKDNKNNENEKSAEKEDRITLTAKIQEMKDKMEQPYQNKGIGRQGVAVDKEGGNDNVELQLKLHLPEISPNGLFQLINQYL